MKDASVAILLSVTFALAVTSQLAIVYGLLHRPPRWRAPLAFFVPILSPYYAHQSGMNVRSMLFVVGVLGYGVLRYVASS